MNLMRKPGRQEFSVIVERDAEGYYVARVPELPGCHTQARSLDKLMERVREAIALCLEVQRGLPARSEFIGVQRVAV
jgi:predicted RNase H-like HicB family nuclease